MTKYTDITGVSFSPTPIPGSGIIYGLYLKAIPPLPVGDEKGSTGVHWTEMPFAGWIYDETNGHIRAATATEADEAGVLYSSY